MKNILDSHFTPEASHRLLTLTLTVCGFFEEPSIDGFGRLAAIRDTQFPCQLDRFWWTATGVVAGLVGNRDFHIIDLSCGLLGDRKHASNGDFAFVDAGLGILAGKFKPVSFRILGVG